MTVTRWDLSALTLSIAAAALGLVLPANYWPIVAVAVTVAFGFYCLGGELDRLGRWQRWTCVALIGLAAVSVVIDVVAVHDLFGHFNY